MRAIAILCVGLLASGLAVSSPLARAAQSEFEQPIRDTAADGLMSLSVSTDGDEMVFEVTNVSGRSLLVVDPEAICPLSVWIRAESHTGRGIATQGNPNGPVSPVMACSQMPLSRLLRPRAAPLAPGASIRKALDPSAMVVMQLFEPLKPDERYTVGVAMGVYLVDQTGKVTQATVQSSTTCLWVGAGTDIEVACPRSTRPR